MINQQRYFCKFQGTSNDFIIILDTNQKIECLKILAKKLCNRNKGIGANGLLIAKMLSEAIYEMIIINQDGSVAEMCGNGLRCFSSFLFFHKLLPRQQQIMTANGIKHCKVTKQSQNIFNVQTKMGKKNQILKISNQFPTLEKDVYLTDSGVPHSIIIYNDLTNVQYEKIGKLIQSKINTNVNFCKINKYNEIELITYERGCGITLACGTGACATVFVCFKLGLCKQEVNVQMKGGSIKIIIDDLEQTTMIGTAQLIAQGIYY